ncbi:MAG: class I SAM-dependent methyltransferase, partial [Janthinobacterium sp.]
LDRGVAGNLEFVQADAEKLPFPDNHFDCVTIAFGLRNVTHTDDAIRSLVALSLLAEKGIQRYHGNSTSLEWDKGGELACQHLGLSQEEAADLLDELHEMFDTDH